MNDLVYIHEPEILGLEPESSKRLLRMVAGWEKLSADEQRKFREHVDGIRPLNRDQDLMPTIAVAKLLKTSFYRVKAMVESGVLVPVEVKKSCDNADYYKFRRGDVEALIQSGA